MFLLCGADGLPKALTLIYSTVALVKLSPGTQRNSLRAISYFYDFFQQKYGAPFDDYISRIDYAIDILIFEIPAFSTYLTYGNNSIPFIEGSKNTRGNISAGTHNNYVLAVIKYFRWLSIRLMTPKYQRSNEKHTISLKLRTSLALMDSFATDLCISRLSTNIHLGNKNFHSLPSSIVQALFLILRPSSDSKKNNLNPFEKENQLRNFLIFKLFLSYGLRRSELFSLETNSIKPHRDEPGAFSLIITNSESTDIRYQSASIKNKYSHRIIRIEEQDARQLHFYIDHVRGVQKDHSFLFVSSRKPVPLAENQANKMLNEVYSTLKAIAPSTCDTKFIEFVDSIRVHDLRHTWATQTLELLHKNADGDMQTALTQLRALGGWSPTSRMPNLYAERFLSESASKILISKRV